jgi:hypothetical protein
MRLAVAAALGARRPRIRPNGSCLAPDRPGAAAIAALNRMIAAAARGVLARNTRRR